MIDNKAGCFEWFGLDFMVDQEYNVWNLECNIRCAAHIRALYPPISLV